MIRVVSLALFGERNYYRGDNSFFRRHLGAVVRGYRALFPGWEIRIHHDDSIYAGNYGAALCGLARRGIIRLVRVSQGEALGKASLWRMLPLWDPDVEYAICRDVDSAPLYLDRLAVEEFIASGATAHAIGAVESHNLPFAAGLCGFHAPRFREITGLRSWDALVSLPNDMDWQSYGSDEYLMRTRLWPLLRASTIEHRIGGAPQFPGVMASRTSVDGDVPSLAPELKRSRELAPYMGASGFNAPVAVDIFGDPSGEIERAESFAGESSTGETARLPWAVTSSSRNDYYSFFAPLSVRMWRRVGFRVRLFLVGTVDEWRRDRRSRLVLERSREAGASICFVDHLENYNDGTLAQVVRLFASGYGFDDDEYACSYDVDAWPLSRAFYLDRDLDRLQALSAAANGHQFAIQVGARAGMWRAIMGITRDGGDQALRAAIREGVSPGGSMAEENWAFDERLLARRLGASPHLANAERTVRVGEPMIDRIDRVAWREPRSLDGLVDAHLPRPGWEHWPKLRAILALALPDELEWFDSYFAEWSGS